MKKLLSFILICVAAQLHAQELYFPKTAYADSASLAKSMPALAAKVIALYKEADKQTYYDNLFRYQVVAGRYAESIKTLDSLRNLIKVSDPAHAAGIGFQFQAYAAAKMRQAERKVSFNDAFMVMFPRLFNALSEDAAVVASGYFDYDVAPMRKNLYKFLGDADGGDSIPLAEAQSLCRAYNSVLVYSQVVSLAKPLIAELDNKQFIREDSVLIRSRDGATLTATITRRKDITARQPAIFVFNIYNTPRDRSLAKEAAIQGYVGVVVNTRGKYLSPEAIEPFEHDATDAYDIIDWISKQPWSNGKVGMFGGSYLGFSQWAAAKRLHPALKTIIPQVSVGIGIDYPMQGNIFMTYMLRWIHYVTNSKETDQAEFDNDTYWNNVFRKWYRSGRAFRALDTIEGRPNAIFQRWLKHPSHDAYWQNMVAYKKDFSAINIPILTTTGYYDADQLGAMYYFKQHHLWNKNANHYLLIGPYDHGGAQGIPSTVLNGYPVDPVANISINTLTYQWFNYILKDSARPAILEDKINYQVMGTNQWKHVPTMAAMNNDTLKLYLTSGRTAGSYQLDAQPGTGFIGQEVDFTKRGDTIPAVSGNIIDSALDVTNGIAFVSEPFARAFEINGSYLAELKASINKKDMDIAIAMYERMPDGKHFSLGTGQVRASYAKDRSKRQLLQPGKTETISFPDIFFTSRKISAGSRLVVVVSIHKNPFWQINYGTGKEVSDETIADAGEPLRIKWYGSSVIKVPVHL